VTVLDLWGGRVASVSGRYAEERSICRSSLAPMCRCKLKSESPEKAIVIAIVGLDDYFVPRHNQSKHGTWLRTGDRYVNASSLAFMVTCPLWNSAMIRLKQLSFTRKSRLQNDKSHTKTSQDFASRPSSHSHQQLG
jgi:hypothetical protein